MLPPTTKCFPAVVIATRSEAAARRHCAGPDEVTCPGPRFAGMDLALSAYSRPSPWPFGEHSARSRRR
jgi:hypothetical protein